jgi:hypothetical protein
VIRFWTIGFFLCLTGMLFAQHGAAVYGLGGNEANRDAGFGLSNNPGAAFTGKAAGGVWGRQRFTGTALVQGGAAVAFRNKGTMYGGDFTYNGTSNFSVNAAHLSLCQVISSRFSVGFSVGYTTLYQVMLAQRPGWLSGKLGAAFQLNEKWDASAVLMNPWNRTYDGGMALPAGALALGYKINPFTRAGFQYRYNAQNQPVYGIALRHEYGKRIVFNGALQTGPEPFSGGVEYKSGTVVFALSTRYHTYLGFSPAFSLVWTKR